MWNLIVSVPDHCLSFYFSHDRAHLFKPSHGNTCLSHMRITKAQISLRVGIAWSAALFFFRCIQSIETINAFARNSKVLARFCSSAGPICHTFEGSLFSRQGSLIRLSFKLILNFQQEDKFGSILIPKLFRNKN